MTAQDIINQLGLIPHPEGGWYRETWRDRHTGGDGRGCASLIYYLLERGQRSHWHKVDASEIWLHQGGGTLRLHTWSGADVTTRRLGQDLAEGEVLQACVEPGEWQAAETNAAWVLVGCMVAPGFTFAGFEMAPPGWEPGHPGHDAGNAADCHGPAPQA
ncbi:cupin domain-containing protein [Acetobacter sp. TBRC 12305]|uniref:Cupin domain-containing protein n=1 Tax=Acetobacter garciniae TaxID=2817435 RepID=A0A939HHF2_9PROT|nr:cupin domain-containing protein [Acetobacter garciniae]MBO1324455.1 cupin domain-containing protein [Acetobacter garciniae]MBX0344144.1 cupin domain-containing protein [Acetobacter garciniae]